MNVSPNHKINLLTARSHKFLINCFESQINRYPTGYTLLFGSISIASYSSLAFTSNHSGLLPTLLSLSWLCYFGILYSSSQANRSLTKKDWLLILTFAFLFRLVMFLLPGLDTDDYERYLFDGALIANGINPYSAIPMQYPELWGNLLRKAEFKTIYPPASEALFYIANFLGGTLGSLRLMALAPDLSCIAILYLFLKKNNLPLTALIVYLWNPLILKEGFNSAHIDTWAMLGVLLFYYFIICEKRILAVIAIAFATLVKIVPGIILLPWLLSQKNRYQLFTLGFIYLVLLAAAFLIFFPETPFVNLSVFFFHIEGKGVIFRFFSQFLSSENSRTLLTLIGGLVLLQLVWFSNRYKNPPCPLSHLLTAELLFVTFIFSTMGFPWYLMATIPLLTIKNNHYLMGFVATTQIIYYTHHASVSFALAILATSCILYALFQDREISA